MKIVGVTAKKSWIYFAKKIIGPGYRLKSYYSVPDKAIKDIPTEYLKEGLHAIGYKCSTCLDPGLTEWCLTTDPWEKDYSNSFTYRVNETPQLEIVDVRYSKKPKYFGDLSTLNTWFEYEGAPLAFPVLKRVSVPNIVRANKLYQSKDFICEKTNDHKPMALINIFHSPWFGTRAVLSRFQYFRTGHVRNLIHAPDWRLPAMHAIKELISKISKRVFSMSIYFFAKGRKITDYYVSDIYYADGEDYSLLPFEDRIKITQSLCEKWKLTPLRVTEKPRPDSAVAYYRHLDSRAYTDFTYVSLPVRPICLYCTAEHYFDGYKVLDLAVWSEEKQDFVKFSESIIYKPKRAKKDLPNHNFYQQHADKIVSVLCDTLVSGATEFKSYKTYPLQFKALHADELTLESVLNRY